MSHEEAATLLGAYALDAVEADERAAIEAHLADCPRCRAEVAAHQEVVALLGNSGAVAPAGLWERIAAGLEERPPALDLDRVRQTTPAAGSARPRPARDRRSGSRGGVPYRVAAAALAVAAAAIAVLGIEVVRLNDRSTPAPVAATATLDRLVQAALVDPSARQVQLTDDSHAVLARAVIRPSGEAYVFDTRMVGLPAGRTYQLWAQSGADKVSVALMGSAPGIVAFHVPPANVSALMVTAEVAGGAVQPTGAVLAFGTVPKTA